MSPQATDEQDVDTHDPAGMAAFMRKRAHHSREFVKLTSEEQIRHFMQRWQKNVLPHYAFRFDQGAEMIERLVRERQQAELERDHAVEKLAEKSAGLDSFAKIAEEAFTEWDNDNDPRVGKLLLALAGARPGYRAEIDAIHALRRPADDASGSNSTNEVTK